MDRPTVWAVLQLTWLGVIYNAPGVLGRRWCGVARVLVAGIGNGPEFLGPPPLRRKGGRSVSFAASAVAPMAIGCVARNPREFRG